jgi:hypothetical protein
VLISCSDTTNLTDHKLVVGVANSTNYYRCSNWNDGIGANDDQKFVPFDAYYNGSMNLNYIPIGADTSRPYLETINASLAIGQMNLSSNSQVSRSKWDANNFFMEIDVFPPKCNSSQTCAPYIHATSSSSYWYWSQVCLTHSLHTNYCLHHVGVDYGRYKKWRRI